MKNYYKVLGICRHATEEVVKKAYHALALRLHPDKNKGFGAEDAFKELAEAYGVLKDAQKRRDYDEFLNKFLAERASANHDLATPQEPIANGKRKEKREKDPPIIQQLPVTLEEVANGCVKPWHIQRQEIGLDGQVRLAKRTLHIQIRPGCKTGSRITFYGVGSQKPNRIPADIVFIIRNEPHPVFHRDGCDLHYTTYISLKEALCGVNLQLQTLQGEKVAVSTFNSVIRPGSTHTLAGYGLPGSHSQRGDIVVSFQIQFPQWLSTDQVSQLAGILPD